MSEHVLIERKGAVQIIRLNRADKKNAITRAMYAEMAKALVDGDADDAVRVHVFLGVPGAFSSGNDMQDFMAAASDGNMGNDILNFLAALSGSKKPVISGVDGLAIGIGTTIHLHCDLTFATNHALFRTPFVDLGLVPEAASSLLAPSLMGHQKAFALLALGHGFDAQAALEAGIVYKVVESSELEAEVLKAAEEIAAKPPQAMQIARSLMRMPAEPVADRIAREAQHFAERLTSSEAREAVMAFLSRKK
ncbi:crotonase/enoyl-CoA hydratase family protein [Brucella pseudogrignonensis]|uniref:crotonase/enoyl-CoA hydratase family protein n=1 Tax=Brucella pseudogrignonensis TaxID=419475 RepID=UPI000CFD5F39|nr:crotonase/enoyl-CoA hydratase family protein [Brucella pseudogrignonensis]MQP41710.1 crotonase/enoyl-CoA hydratase family protein [Ochrobactrum sp. MYb237]PQZ42786.1 enoyl-CoA hydratase [Brucella pseudogrignonensis]PRA37938.1 enoyl-CoA hydratase [Brucella pseudogrignonensis]PRA63753.1 enoyl-CoA hydratase [Brucella pseudogrignonensis]